MSKDSLNDLINQLAAPPTDANSAVPPVGVKPRDLYLASLTPLHLRLAAALTRLPAEALVAGLHMEQLWPLITGRQRAKPRAFEVADALRKLGWQRIRLYSDKTAASGTFWFPPEVDPQDAKAALRSRIKEAK